MKKVIFLLNHVQAGFGSDENAMLKPEGKKAVIGPGKTLEPILIEPDAKIIATLYCEDQYFCANKLFRNMVKLVVEKVNHLNTKELEKNMFLKSAVFFHA